MGWNDSRVYLVAPGWRMARKESSPARVTDSGAPVSTLSPERSDDPGEPRVMPGELQEHLCRSGLVVEERSEGSIVMRTDRVEAFLVLQAGEIPQVTFTFRLTAESPRDLGAWEMLLLSVCNRWKMRIYDPQIPAIVSATEFRSVLGRTRAWAEFSARYGWSA